MPMELEATEIAQVENRFCFIPAVEIAAFTAVRATIGAEKADYFNWILKLILFRQMDTEEDQIHIGGNREQIGIDICPEKSSRSIKS